MKLVRNYQDGFTIAELLIAVSVAAIASVLIFTAFVYVNGSILKEQTKTAMIRDSQLFLRRMVEDVRISNNIKTSNDIADSYNGGGWTTSDPAYILIITVPATDENKNLVYDDITGQIYYHEVVYFGDSGTMYRHLLANPGATDSIQTSTCPAPNVGCLRDIKLVENLENMLFKFYDSNDVITTIPENARSVEITINLRKRLYGEDIVTSNTTRMTLRNE
jgi:prepilin-type N-terminal cleavage/methylation domain-containing protein